MKKFEHELEELQERMAKMASVTQSMVELATAAVQDRTKDVRKQIDESEATLDRMQTEIDHDAVRMLTVYSPVATQLRYVLVVTHITAQMERIGDAMRIQSCINKPKINAPLLCSTQISKTALG